MISFLRLRIAQPFRQAVYFHVSRRIWYYENDCSLILRKESNEYTLRMLAYSLRILKCKIARKAHDVEETYKTTRICRQSISGNVQCSMPGAAARTDTISLFSLFFIDVMHTSVWSSYWEYRSASTLWNRNDVISLVCIGAELANGTAETAIIRKTARSCSD